MLNRKIQTRNKVAPFVLMLVLLANISLKSQTIAVDSARFPIGGKVNLTITVPFNQEDKIVWPVIKDTLSKSIEVLSKSKLDTITSENGSFLQQILSITSFDTGYIPVPPVSFQLTRGGQSSTLTTEPLLLEVFKVKVDPKADIRDIKPIMKAPLTFAELIPWLIGLLLVGIIVYGVLYYIRNRKKPVIEKPAPKIVTPSWEIAIRKLEELKNEQIWQRGQIKEYYTRLTDILREYFEVRFNVNAAEMTSTEIIEAMRPHINDENGMPSLKELLYLSDMAKFAKAQPDAFENEQSIKYGYEIVNLTRPAQPGTEKRESKVL